MYQYKAILKSTKQKIAEGHSIEDIEKQVVHFRREQKYGIHTRKNEPIEIIHLHRNKTIGVGHSKEEIIKII